jgi:hypothetical protein
MNYESRQKNKQEMREVIYCASKYNPIAYEVLKGEYVNKFGRDKFICKLEREVKDVEQV